MASPHVPPAPLVPAPLSALGAADQIGRAYLDGPESRYHRRAVLAIDARDLGKQFAGAFGLGVPKIALDRVTLAVPRGSAFGLIGLNGAGKTTFIKAMLAVLRPSSGTLTVLGGDPEDPAVRARIGYLPERLYLPPAWSARTFLASIARLRGLAASTVAAEIDRQLARVGLAPADAARRVGGYSKGMRQRLGLAGALLGSPELLVLDEPTDGVDPLGRGEIRALLAEERARGATIFLNSHLLSETARICDRIGILHGGRVLLEGSMESLAVRDDRWVVRVEGAAPRVIDGDVHALNAAIDLARAEGALISGVERDTKDLEQLLREAVG